MKPPDHRPWKIDHRPLTNFQPHVLISFPVLHPKDLTWTAPVNTSWSPSTDLRWDIQLHLGLSLSCQDFTWTAPVNTSRSSPTHIPLEVQPHLARGPPFLTYLILKCSACSNLSTRCYDFDRFRLYSRDRSQSVSDNAQAYVQGAS